MSDTIISRIVQLDRERWQDYRLEFHYVSHNYYDVQLTRSGDDFNVSFIKRPFEKPYEKTPDNYDRLFQPWWDDIKVWGIVEEKRLIAAIETTTESWNNRLRVTELWVDDACRRRGIGTALMDIAVRRAKHEKRRALVLETQSCNEGAIAFYLNYGFTLTGFDSCDYRNNDLQRKEVHLEMGTLFEY